MITVFATLRLNPAQRDEALREFDKLVAETREEQGCHTYVISADLADPDTLYVFEEWDSHEAMEAHQQSEHFTAHRSRSAGHLLAAEVSHYEAASCERRSL